MDLAPDTVLEERYRIVRLLGTGGMGAVYEGVHLKLGRSVAIKVLHSKQGPSVEAVQRFHREAMAATAIKHPNIVDVTDFGTLPDGTPFMVLEYLDGRDWSVDLEEQGPQPIGKTATIASAVCRALSAAHAKSIVHRDLKPENVFLVRREGDPDFVKVLDFGISKFVDAAALGDANAPTDLGSLTKTGETLGTPYYMSPEQCHGRSDLDARSDIYSLGVILFRALTGLYPFDDAAFPMLMLKIMTEPTPDVRSWREDVPPELAALVNEMLQKKSLDRPANCAAVERRLRPYLDETATPMLVAGAPSRQDVAMALPKAPSGAAGAPKTQDRSALRWIAFALATFGVAAIAVVATLAVVFWTGSAAEPPPPIGPATVENAPQTAEPDLCEGRDPEQCTELGRAHDRGDGVPRDHLLARGLFESSCERGHAPACTELGWQLTRGIGGDRDVMRAGELYERACEAGDMRACSHLAGLFAQVEGHPRDLARAIALFERACEGGFGLACSNLGTFHARGLEVPRDEVRARELYARACESDNAAGCGNLAYAIQRGVGGARDLVKARRLYERSCEGGHARACTNLGVLHDQGRGGPRDRARAVGLSELGCEGGDPGGCVNLGVYYENGTVVPTDHVRARELQTRACDAGHALGCNNLGYLLERGRGGPRDRDGARDLYRRACDAGESQACDRLRRLR